MTVRLPAPAALGPCASPMAAVTPSRRGLLSLGAAGLLAVPGGAEAQPGLLLRETFDAEARTPQQMLGGVLTIGQDDAWTGEVGNGAYTLTNGSRAGSIRTFYMSRINDVLPGPIEADVRVESEDPQAGAGVLAAHDPASLSYVLLLVGGEGNYAVVVSEQRSARVALSGTSSRIRRGQANLVRTERGPEGVSLFINGARLGSFGNPAMTGTGVGIGAFGRGRFSFEEVRIFAPRSSS